MIRGQVSCYLLKLKNLVSAFVIGDGANWVDANHGGFFPHGFSSTLSGAATLIFAYIGYEVVGAAAEEASDPRR